MRTQLMVGVATRWLLVPVEDTQQAHPLPVDDRGWMRRWWDYWVMGVDLEGEVWV